MIPAPPVQTPLPALEARARRSPNAANVRALADAYLAARRFEDASRSFARASELYARLGDPNAAAVLRGYADRYRTEIGLYVDRPPAVPNVLARNEPPAGCLLGAFSDREPSIPSLVGDGRRHGDPAAFERAVGRPHAVAFTYLRLGSPFPRAWCRRLRILGMAAHLAVEPTSTAQGSDPRLLNALARECREAALPIYLRFAGEMNGAWTPYHGDPEGYRRMFAAMAGVVHAEAPNVATVWCPNDVPEAEIGRYFPGDDAVDWVGVNFYSVVYNDGDRAKAAGWRNPLDSLSYIHRAYSGRHPIMVGEWAATHRSSVDGIERPGFARAKIAAFYAGLPRRYPRVKAVHWLSMDTTRYALAGRRLNDFSLLADAGVAAAYREATAGPYYLGRPGETAPFVPLPLADGAAVRAGDRLSVDARTYVPNPAVEVRVDGALVRRRTDPGEIAFPLPATGGKAWTVEVRLLDDRGAIAGRRAWRLNVR